MADEMLTELYKRAFETKAEAEFVGDSETEERRRQVAFAKNNLLAELIDIRTEQIRFGREG
jgi:hypothetical protein